MTTKPLRSTYPIGHLLNPATRYVPAASTDIRATFARVVEQAKRAERIVTSRWERAVIDTAADRYADSRADERDAKWWAR